LADYLKLDGQSQTSLARKLSVTQGAVSQWLKDGVPAERVRDIVATTRGVVSAHDLRPDLYPEGFVFSREMLAKAREATA